MQKREVYKNIEIRGRNWRIGKFDAFTGSYIAYTLISEILPMGLNEKIGVPLPSGNSTQMSKSKFMELQKDCLGVCSEMLGAGPTPVIGDNGNWGVQDIEHDTALVLNLTIQALVWNITSFFDENLLASLKGTLPALFQQDSKT